MRTTENDPTPINRLRVLFGESSEVVSIDLPVRATMGDVALTLGKLSEQRYGKPSDICVTFNRRAWTSQPAMSRRLPVLSHPTSEPLQYPW